MHAPPPSPPLPPYDDGRLTSEQERKRQELDAATVRRSQEARRLLRAAREKDSRAEKLLQLRQQELERLPSTVRNHQYKVARIADSADAIGKEGARVGKLIEHASGVLDEVSIKLSGALKPNASAAQVSSAIASARSQLGRERAELASFASRAKPHVSALETAVARIGASAYDMLAFSHASDRYVSQVCGYDVDGEMYYL